jgi:outer membrane protein OmpA-like peptidoglycan-associated protein
MWGRVTRIVLSLPVLIVAGLFGLYLAFGFFIVNPLAQKLLPWVGETKLASRLSVQQVKFNPLTLEATVDGLKLADKNGQLLAGFEKLYINIGTAGLIRWAWRIQDIQLKGPRATLAVQPGGKLNWAALIAKLNEDKKPPSGDMPRVLIDHIKIDGGQIEYTDADRAGRPFKALLQPLGIELDAFSMLPGEHGSYRIAAKLPEQGGTFSLKGDIGLNPLSSKGTIALEGLRLADMQRAIKDPPNFELLSGTMAAEMGYRFAMVRGKAGAEAPSVQVNNANLSVLNFALAPRGGGAPVLELAEARIGNANLDLAERRVGVASVSLTGAKLAATRNVKGALDWQTLFATGEGKSAPVTSSSVQSAPEKGAPTQTAAPWKIAVREIKLADWAARFTDQGFASPLVVSASGFGMTTALVGEVGDKPAIEVGPLNAALGPVRVLSGEQEAAVLQRAVLLNANLKLAENRLVIDAVELNGLRTSVVLDKDKTLNWNEILKAAPGVPAPTPAPARTAAVKPAAADKPGLDVQLARFSLDGLEVGIVDRSNGEPVQLDLVKGFVTLKSLGLDMNRAVPVEAGFGLRQGGTFNAGGTVIPGKASGKLEIKLAALSLKPFTPYVNRFAKLHLHSGAASTRGRLLFARAETGMKVEFKGGFAVDSLGITEEGTQSPFFGWESLSSDSLDLKLNPDSLHMNELVAVNPFGKVVIFEDKSINLTRILRSPEPGGAAPARADVPAKVVTQKATAPVKAPTAKAGSPAPESTKAGTSGEAAPFPLAIERLRINSADFEFADLSLKPPFGTVMHDLSGVVTGLSNDPATTALVELDGKVDEFGSARVRGSIQPFRATEFTDLTLAFRNLEMTNMTPYSGKFAGRKVDSGKLSVDLEYKIKNRQLAGENKVVINKLKLGERVESPEAVSLPLDLAIALLEDSDGVIDLDLPVSGSLDDPDFSYGRIIWKAIVNVLTKLVTAPFRALGNLLGISSDKLEAVEFDFGAAALLPPEREKLKDIGQALAKRPALTLSVVPAYDPKKDARAIQELRIRRDVARQMGLTVEADQEPGPVDTANPRAQKALEALYGDRFGKQGGLKAVQGESGKPKEGAKPVHADLLERLTLQIPVTDVELQRLAQARGEAVRQTLMALGKVDPAKISVGEPVKNDDGKVAVCKVTLGAGGKTAPAPAAVP